MGHQKFSLIAAACENMGIGINGKLPWTLKSEMKYFNRMTRKVKDTTKYNAVVMGKKTYFGIDEIHRPLPHRLNVILSNTTDSSAYPSNVLLCKSLQEAMNKLCEPPYNNNIENIWIIGGTQLYDEAMKSNQCHRVYLTEIKGKFECDTFFPDIPNNFKLIVNDDVDCPSEEQEENGVKYYYRIYEKY